MTMIARLRQRVAPEGQQLFDVMTPGRYETGNIIFDDVMKPKLKPRMLAITPERLRLWR